MKLYECEGKDLLASHGVVCPRGVIAGAPEAARDAAASFGGRVVVKAQLLAGKRGKANLIRFAGSPDEAENQARDMLGQVHQGREVVRRLLVEEAVDAKREMYLAIIVDRNNAVPTILACARGGMDIEEITAECPQELFQIPVDPTIGMQPFQVRYLADKLGLSSQAREFALLVSALYEFSRTYQAILVEINPLMLDTRGSLLAVDAKVELDDSALEQHPELKELLANRSLALRGGELRAMQSRDKGLNAYVELDGEIAVIANGASLGMIAFDALSEAGATPAAFCDLGGDAGSALRGALELVAENPTTRVVLVDVVGGGITRLDVVADTLAAYARENKNSRPVVVRLDGINAEEHIQRLRRLGMEVYRDLPPALEKAIALNGDAGGASGRGEV